MRDPVLDQMQEGLTRIPGVTGVRVAGEEAPSEIHIVSSGSRPPKQIARDVESLCAASFGVSIDHRIVSVVQLGATDAPQQQQRPVIDTIVLTTGSAGSVKVVLRWPDESVSEGDEEAPPTRDGRARAATKALVKALQPVLNRKKAKVAVEHVAIMGAGQMSSVQVQAVYQENGSSIPVVGAALIHDDIATASVHAALHALNRKLV